MIVNTIFSILCCLSILIEYTFTIFAKMEKNINACARIIGHDSEEWRHGITTLAKLLRNVMVCNFSLIAFYNHYIHGQFHHKVQDNTIAN